MPLSFPPGAVAAKAPADIRLQIVSPCASPPEGDGWLHKIKHDGHRLVAIIPSRGALKLLSRNGHDRTPLFRTPFRKLASSGRPIVLDGEIAVPDERGVTHIDLLQAASGSYGADRLTYFAFDLLYLDGHDLRRCPIEDRKLLLRDVIGTAGCEPVVYVDHVLGIGQELFEVVRQIGAEGIVSKRRGSLYGTTRYSEIDMRGDLSRSSAMSRLSRLTPVLAFSNEQPWIDHPRRASRQARPPGDQMSSLRAARSRQRSPPDREARGRYRVA